MRGAPERWAAVVSDRLHLVGEPQPGAPTACSLAVTLAPLSFVFSPTSSPSLPPSPVSFLHHLIFFLFPRLEDDLRIETSKRAAWAEENERRRTDYIPAIVALVKALGKSGKLEKMVKDAVERQASKPDHDDD